MNALGHNENGMVYCGLCNWQHQCYSMEEIEFRLARHLKEEHGRTLLFRRDDETGKVRDIPVLTE